MNLLKNGHKTFTQLRHVTVILNTRTPPWGGGVHISRKGTLMNIFSQFLFAILNRSQNYSIHNFEITSFCHSITPNYFKTLQKIYI